MSFCCFYQLFRKLKSLCVHPRFQVTNVGIFHSYFERGKKKVGPPLSSFLRYKGASQKQELYKMLSDQKVVQRNSYLLSFKHDLKRFA